MKEKESEGKREICDGDRGGGMNKTRLYTYLQTCGVLILLAACSGVTYRHIVNNLTIGHKMAALQKPIDQLF